MSRQDAVALGVHPAGTHVFGRWLRCLICGQDIAENCRDCRALHDHRCHRAPAPSRRKSRRLATFTASTATWLPNGSALSPVVGK